MLRQTFKTLIIAVLLVGTTQAELKIEITQGACSRTPVAVVPFAWAGSSTSVPLDVADVVSADLTRSGRFARTRLQQYESHGPVSTGWTGSDRR